MCVIIVGGPHRPTRSILRAAERQNPDGGGIAWITDQGVSVRKGLDHRQILRVLDGIPSPTPFVIHFRFTTVGKTTAALAHPFLISPTSPTRVSGDGLRRVLFHNGTVPDWGRLLDRVDATPSGDLSDSRAVAVYLGHRRPQGRVFPDLDRIPGKFVVLDRTGPLVYPRSLVGWHERGGVFYSNLRWTHRLPSGDPSTHPSPLA